MSASGQPQLRSRSFYPHPFVKCSSRSNSEAQLSSGESKIETSRKVGTRRVWQSNRAGRQCELHKAELCLDGPSCRHSKEELLFMRQLMIDRRALEEKDIDGVPSMHMLSKRTSTDSVCSTMDTRSEISDELEEATSCNESMSVVEESSGSRSLLRACAPEFVPSTLGGAACVDSVPESKSVEPVWIDTSTLGGSACVDSMPESKSVEPIWIDTTLGSSACVDSVPESNSVEPVWIDTCLPAVGIEITDMTEEGQHDSSNYCAEFPSDADYLDMAAWRCFEWRQYCGLTDDIQEYAPVSFLEPWAYGSTMAEVFATSRPGELFATSDPR